MGVIMDNFRKLFEAFDEERTPEEMLELAIELEITNLLMLLAESIGLMSRFLIVVQM